MNNEIPRGRLVIYGAGGCGINLAARYVNAVLDDNNAAITPYFIDTSHANIPSNADPNSIFILEEKEGSGKIRTENRADIAKAARPIIQKFQPGDVNVVVFSGSGGTGSVLGPYLISKLLEDGKPVVAVVVGSDECERAATNTLDTIRSLDGVARKQKRMVPMYYAHLGNNEKRSNIDVSCWAVISALSVLASRRNQALDLKDITNFLNYASPVTSVEPQLSALEVYRNNQDADSAAEFGIAVASLLDNPDSEGISFRPEYMCVGYPGAPLPENVHALHFVAGVGPIAGMYKNLSKATQAISVAKSARIETTPIAADAQVDDDGMAF